MYIYMLTKAIHTENIIGLKEIEIAALQKQFGKNIFSSEKQRNIFHVLLEIIREPMFILLALACTLYFILGSSNEGWMMMAAMIFVSTISLYQDAKSTKALKALKGLTEPKIVVLRDGKEQTIQTTELVPGDIVLLEEGNKIPADAHVIKANDLSVNESVITGESMSVDKDEDEQMNLLYQGTIINTGKCYAKVFATGNNTKLGKLGKSVSGYSVQKTLLQIQITKFVKALAIFGISAFCIIWLINYLKTEDLILSLMFGLTLAMASIPEEIPVAFSSFMALGAYQMSKLGIISRQPQTIENLGAVSVICLDKTGTITENRMVLKSMYDYEKDALFDLENEIKINGSNLLRYAMLASEINPFDAMEKAIIEAYQKNVESETEVLSMVYEYPLEGKPPMMTHVYAQNKKKIIAGKGATERIIEICKLDDATKNKINEKAILLASRGYRILGVASSTLDNETFPEKQDDFNWKFEGLLALYDAPKKNINNVFKKIYEANISIKIITGDFPETTVNIASQVGIKNCLKYLTGNEIMEMEDAELQQKVREINIFARMFPEAKLKIIEALKASGEIVAMTGDGVNDAPALKSAHIGIAMGMRGTEMARQSADLILTDDNLDKVTDAIQYGRKIYSNLKKAIRYIISIHIPIIFTASLPLILSWKYPNIFTPVHIIFLEIIMGPTCSIFYEREPVETNIMQMQPRQRDIGIFNLNELLISIIQGIVISIGVLVLYYFYMFNGHTLSETRTIVFTTMILANIFLTFSNRSFTENFSKTIFYRNNFVLPVLILSITFLCIIHLIPIVKDLFQLSIITIPDFLLCLGVAFTSVMWFEVYKTGLSIVKKQSALSV